MGIFINLLISKSVTQEEWEKVYEETLQLMKQLPFAERREKKIHGIDTICLVRTKEREESCGWNDVIRVGWSTEGDLETMKTAEDYYMPRNLIGDNEIEADAGDAMLGALPAYMDYDWKDERFSHVYGLWGSKTQGEPYHMYLLAVAALIEARLGTKAFTYGDITRGQFKKAVEIANRYLEESIALPDRCHMERLLKRVSQLPLSSQEQLAIFEHFYLGTQNAEFGEYMRQMFSGESIEAYWKNKFRNAKIGTIGFDNTFSEYLLWGFGLEQVCEYIHFADEEGKPKYEEFVERVMDAKLHLKDKNCADPLEIDQEEEHPYGIATLFAQFVFAGARNKKVDRYISIEEIKKELMNALGAKCDVEAIIDKYLEEESKQIEINIANKAVSEEDSEDAVKRDPSEAFGQVMDIKRKVFEKAQEEYDIGNLEQLMFYEDGDTMHPNLEKSIAGFRKFLDSLLEEKKLQELLQKEAGECCAWLVEQNQYLLIRDEHWDKIFTDIEKNRESFGRYYSLFRVEMNTHSSVEMGKALLINDELYNYSQILANKLDKEEDNSYGMG